MGMRRLTRQQREREAWTRFIDGAAVCTAGMCSECGAEMPASRLAQNKRTCSVLCGKNAQSSKYGGKRVTFNGREYPSQREANHAAKLQALEAAGQIWELEYQKRIVLVEGKPGIPSIAYYADFAYRDHQGPHVQDAKGMKTKEYLLKKRLAALLLNITIEEV